MRMKELANGLRRSSWPAPSLCKFLTLWAFHLGWELTGQGTHATPTHCHVPRHNLPRQHPPHYIHLRPTNHPPRPTKSQRSRARRLTPIPHKHRENPAPGHHPRTPIQDRKNTKSPLHRHAAHGTLNRRVRLARPSGLARRKVLCPRQDGVLGVWERGLRGKNVNTYLPRRAISSAPCPKAGACCTDINHNRAASPNSLFRFRARRSTLPTAMSSAPSAT